MNLSMNLTLNSRQPVLSGVVVLVMATVITFRASIVAHALLIFFSSLKG